MHGEQSEVTQICLWQYFESRRETLSKSSSQELSLKVASPSKLCDYVSSSLLFRVHAGVEIVAECSSWFLPRICVISLIHARVGLMV